MNGFPYHYKPYKNGSFGKGDTVRLFTLQADGKPFRQGQPGNCRRIDGGCGSNEDISADNNDGTHGDSRVSGQSRTHT